jgi:preprotein translocase subunit SecG
MLVGFLTVIHVITCIFMIILILLQSGKSADMAATFGGASSQTAFGPRGAASAFAKATTASVIIFMLTSLSLSILASRHSAGSGSVTDKYKGQTTSQPAQQNPPAQNAPAPAQQPK